MGRSNECPINFKGGIIMNNKYRVLNTFVDKVEKKRRLIGEVFECTDKRAEEINKSGAEQTKSGMRFVEKVDADADKESDGEGGDEAVNSLKKRLDAMSVVELREYADQKCKLTFGENVQKPDMIAAILEHEKG